MPPKAAKKAPAPKPSKSKETGKKPKKDVGKRKKTKNPKKENSESSSDEDEDEEVVEQVENDQIDEQEPNNYEFLPCGVCSNSEEVRIILRQCGHVVCVPCMLENLVNSILIDAKTRIPCFVAGCASVIHENDINAVLDEKEPALEMYMGVGQRRYLQHKYNKYSISYALMTDNIKQCPYCKSPYGKEDGCNFVICANAACATSFCWTCAKPIGRPISHYTYASTCRLGYTDYERIFAPFQMALDIHISVLFIFLPFVYVAAFLYVPIIILFLIPISVAYGVWSKAHSTSNFLSGPEYFITFVKMFILSSLSIVLAVPVAIGSILSGNIICSIYWGMIFSKTAGCGCTSDKLNTLLCLMRWAGRLLGIGPYGQLLDSAKKERAAARIKKEEQQAEAELLEYEASSSSQFSTHKIDENGSSSQTEVLDGGEQK
ncbi:unnamed protein product [Caenorhabditis bovis]|uniref:IBR domain-containing protein n=1 Tax=Caenorhabditis bovis TaxID=2654633 RepID=A0A8S1E9D4_9PELO|nr:unnamed protein product [Caenorhabditis bovis]